jgi:hypothetical protein
MITLRTLIALSVAALASACASTGAVTAASPSPTPADEHASHQPEASASAPVAAMDPRMKVMHEMHQKMLNAKTPEERQALMADHMKAMQGGMAMMKDLSGMGAMGAKPAMAGMGAMSGGKGMPADMAMHHRMMAQRMDMMQMMIEMMMDRMPLTPAK